MGSTYFRVVGRPFAPARAWLMSVANAPAQHGVKPAYNRHGVSRISLRFNGGRIGQAQGGTRGHAACHALTRLPDYSMSNGSAQQATIPMFASLSRLRRAGIVDCCADPTGTGCQPVKVAQQQGTCPPPAFTISRHRGAGGGKRALTRARAVFSSVTQT